MEWINVNDRLPELGRDVLILTSYSKMATAHIDDETKPSYGWIDCMRGQHSYGSVTHWMPLPEPPKTV
jgi:hypothetical protein